MRAKQPKRKYRHQSRMSMAEERRRIDKALIRLGDKKLDYRAVRDNFVKRKSRKL